ncbi:MAG TPA: FAD-dependent oxidoreductase, partial [Lapillicoccus sp.]|nr:FAD-dependent oxidoreductase [Lapillicoccus sp.]
MTLPTTATVPVSSTAAPRHESLPHVDRLVVGAGLFGLYGAMVLARKGFRVALLDADQQPMMRASQVNQARVHNGYHYPRSLTTALSSVHYYRRFVHDFADAVNTKFEQIYAIAQSQSFMSSDGFEMFCRRAGVQCDPVDPHRWFRRGAVESAYRTDEFSFDAERLRRIMTSQVADDPRVVWYQPARMAHVDRDADGFTVRLEDGRQLRADGVLNASYAGTNQVLALLGEPPLSLKYELCEITLTNVSDELQGVGLTVMDGEYFSL